MKKLNYINITKSKIMMFGNYYSNNYNYFAFSYNFQKFRNKI